MPDRSLADLLRQTTTATPELTTPTPQGGGTLADILRGMSAGVSPEDLEGMTQETVLRQAIEAERAGNTALAAQLRTEWQTRDVAAKNRGAGERVRGIGEATVSLARQVIPATWDLIYHQGGSVARNLYQSAKGETQEDKLKARATLLLGSQTGAAQTAGFFTNALAELYGELKRLDPDATYTDATYTERNSAQSFERRKLLIDLERRMIEGRGFTSEDANNPVMEFLGLGRDTLAARGIEIDPEEILGVADFADFLNFVPLAGAAKLATKPFVKAAKGKKFSVVSEINGKEVVLATGFSRQQADGAVKAIADRSQPSSVKSLVSVGGGVAAAGKTFVNTGDPVMAALAGVGVTSLSSGLLKYAGPMSRAVARSPEMRAGVVSTVAMAPATFFAFDDAEDRGLQLAGNFGLGVAVGAATRPIQFGRNVIGASNPYNFFRANIPQATERAATTNYGVDQTLDTLSARAAKGLDNTTVNFFEGVRNLFKPREGETFQAAEIYLYNPADASAAFKQLYPTATDAQIQQMATSAQGVAVTQHNGRNVALVRAGSQSLGHEAGHLLLSLIPKADADGLRGLVQELYGAETIQGFNQYYNGLLNRDGEVQQLSPEATTDEIIAENFSAALNGIPVGQGTKSSFSNFIYLTLGTLLERTNNQRLVRPKNMQTPLGLGPSFRLAEALRNVTLARDFDNSNATAEAPSVAEFNAAEDATAPVDAATAAPAGGPITVGTVLPVVRNRDGSVMATNATVVDVITSTRMPTRYQVAYTDAEGKDRKRMVREDQVDAPAAPVADAPVVDPDAPVADAPVADAPVADAPAVSFEGEAGETVKGELAKPLAERQVLVGKYESVDDTGTAKKSRYGQRRADQATQDGTRTSQEKRIIVTNTSRPGYIVAYEPAIVDENLLVLREIAADLAIPLPYDLTTPAGVAEARADFDNYAANQQNGYAGSGAALKRPVGVAGEFAAQNPDYTPVAIPQDRVDVLNLLVGIHPPKTLRAQKGGEPANITARRLAQANGREGFDIGTKTIEVDGVETPLADFNPLRQRIVQADTSIDMMQELRDSLRPVFNQLKVETFTGGLTPAGLAPVPQTALANAGFMPVTREQDSTYLAAVERGDMETVQRMVDEAAKAAGYRDGPFWHGGHDQSFTEFDKLKLGAQTKARTAAMGFFFTPNKFASQAFTGFHRSPDKGDRLVHAWLSPSKDKQKISVSATTNTGGQAFHGRSIPLEKARELFGDTVVSEVLELPHWKEHELADISVKFQETAEPRKFYLSNPNPIITRSTFVGGSGLAGWGRVDKDAFAIFWEYLSETLEKPKWEITSQDVRTWAEGREAAGFTGFIFKDTEMDGQGDVIDQIVVFDPHQIKSADPVVRDDDGNVIPLSKRFDPAQPDIRFMPEVSGMAANLLRQWTKPTPADTKRAPEFNRLRAEEIPQQTQRVYKLVQLQATKPRQAQSLFDRPEDGPKKAFPLGEWIRAEIGRPFISGPLQLRPGFHAIGLPIFDQGKVRASGTLRAWAEVEMPVFDEAAQTESDTGPILNNGMRQGIKDRLIGPGEAYNFKTNPSAAGGGSWPIAGSMKINRLLSNTEVSEILMGAGQEASIPDSVTHFSDEAIAQLNGVAFSRRREGPESANFMPNSGVLNVRKAAADYMRQSGIPYTPHEGYAPINAGLANTIADVYEAGSNNPSDPAVAASYQIFSDEIRSQWDVMTAAGVRAEPWTGEGQPYANSAEMAADVRDNKRLYFFLTEGGFGQGPMPSVAENPMLAPTDVVVNGKPLLINDLFRAIHDYFGHAKEGYQFGARGELNAYLAHSRMFSRDALPAMATETLGQNSWVNFGPHLRNADGKIPKRGEEGYVSPQDRPFADQKVFLLPQDLVDQVNAGAFAQTNQEVMAKFKTNDTVVEALRSPNWMIVTGTQEHLGKFSSPENLAENQRLVAQLTAEGRTFLEVDGKYKGVSDGKSYIVVGVDRTTAARYRADYRQDSVLIPEGFLYEGDHIAPMLVGDTKVGVEATKEDFYTQIDGENAFSAPFDWDNYLLPDGTLQPKSVFDRVVESNSVGPLLDRGDVAGQYMPVAEAGAENLVAARRAWESLGVRSPYFRRWFRGSKVVDGEEQPMRVFHFSSHPEDFGTFKRVRDVGIHFGDAGQAQDRFDYKSDHTFYQDGFRTYPVYLHITNPLRVSDAGSWTVDNFGHELRETGVITPTEFRALKSRPQLAALLKRKGYDGLVYKNTGEVAGSEPLRARIRRSERAFETVYGSLGSNLRSVSVASQQTPEYQAYRAALSAYQDFRAANATDSYVVFDPKQIKSAISNEGTFDGKDPRIDFMPALQARPAKEHSLGDVSIPLIHFSRSMGLTEIDPKHMGKSRADRRQLAGAPTSMFFVAGSPLGQDITMGFNRDPAYEATIDGGRIYDLGPASKDPLGWRSTLDREAADLKLVRAGYAGLYLETHDGRQVVALYEPLAVSYAGKGTGGDTAGAAMPPPFIDDGAPNYFMPATTISVPLNEVTDATILKDYDYMLHHPEAMIPTLKKGKNGKWVVNSTQKDVVAIDTVRYDFFRNPLVEGVLSEFPGGREAAGKMLLGNIHAKMGKHSIIRPETNPKWTAGEQALIDAVQEAYTARIIPQWEWLMGQPELAAGIGWYEEAQQIIEQLLPGEAAQHLLIDLLGATSPNTLAVDNTLLALQVYNRIKDASMQPFLDVYREGRAMAKAGTLKELMDRPENRKQVRKLLIDKEGVAPAKATKATTNKARNTTILLGHYLLLNDGIPRKPTGRRYGMHTSRILAVADGTWIAESKGPKAPNFAGNLKGTTREATIDVWAARFLRRMGWEGLTDGRWRIHNKAENKVLDADFFLGQYIMRHAADRLGVEPDNLQAGLWFGEKRYQEQQGWLNRVDMSADLGDFREYLRATSLSGDGLIQITNPAPFKGRNDLANLPINAATTP